MSSSKVGRCEQTTAHKAPLLTAGDVTPEALQAWETGCVLFFLHKDVAEKEQVGKVTWTLQDPRVQDWYLSDRDRIHTLSFPDFMKEVCCHTPNTFGTVNMECTVDSRLSWSE